MKGLENLSVRSVKRPERANRRAFMAEDSLVSDVFIFKKAVH